jgi:hypothetical protein
MEKRKGKVKERKEQKEDEERSEPLKNASRIMRKSWWESLK